MNQGTAARLCASILVSATFTACSAGTGTDLGDAPQVYAFESRFAQSESSVSYSGQTLRQVLVLGLKAEIDAINEAITVDGEVFAAGEVAARLNFYYRFDSDVAGDLPHGIEADLPITQSKFNDISSGKDLQGKLAGNDEVGQHADWSTEFVGWEGQGPAALVDAWVLELDAMAVAYSTGNIPVDPNGVQIDRFYVDANGRDYQQLLEKLLLGAINYSQAADDYLDDDLEGKGLRSDHASAEEGKNYSALEHAWDEAFGYWGAARGYLELSDDNVADADASALDRDGDGNIDLLTEYNFAASVNAAKRDRGASASASVDLSTQTMQAFLRGRHILSQRDGALSDADFSLLQDERDLAIEGWERALAATAVHYINDVLQDMQSSDYAFVDHAKHWSELKGFALMLQFNPRAQISMADLAKVHGLIGTAPELDAAAFDTYATKLHEARDILGAAFDFDASNLGDDAGENGW